VPGLSIGRGFLDVYGALFTLSNNDVVDLFSNGEIPGLVPLGYGVGIVNENSTVIDYQPTGVSMGVPEPGSLWLLDAGLLGVLGCGNGPPFPWPPGGRIAGTP